MKTTFNKLAKLFSNGRYIKFDGSSYHSKGLMRHIQKPEIKTGLAMGVAIIATEMIHRQSSDIFHNPLLKATFNRISFDILFGIGTTIAINQFDAVMPSYNKAIDTKGTDLNRSKMNIVDQVYLHSRMKIAPLATGLFLTLGILTKPEGQMISLSVFSVILATNAATRGLRAKRLLNGDYVFCDSPPRKEEKSKISIPSFGKTTPSPQ